MNRSDDNKPTAPEGRPEENNLLPESGASRSVQTVTDRQDMKDSAASTGEARVAISPQESPAETATATPDAGERIATNAALLRLFKGEYRDSGDRHSDALFVKDQLASITEERDQYQRMLFQSDNDKDSLRAQLKDMTDQFLAVSGQLGEARKAVDNAYWRGYRARLDEQTVEQPEPKNPTLWRYLQNAHDKKITFHTIGANRMPDGGFHFYIHPQSVSGETEDYLIWSDPLNWSDMLANRKDIPEPDVEKFKTSIRKALSQSDSSGAGKEGEKS